MQIDLNADMGEGFGVYRMGNDADLLGIVTSANVACGFHGGDPTIMHGLAMRAKELGVALGAHPGFGDLWGLRLLQGRRSPHFAGSAGNQRLSGAAPGAGAKYRMTARGKGVWKAG